MGQKTSRRKEQQVASSRNIENCHLLEGMLKEDHDARQTPTFWDWERTPGDAQCWVCSWPSAERAFSDGVIRAWVHVAATGRAPDATVWPTWEPARNFVGAEQFQDVIEVSVV